MATATNASAASAKPSQAAAQSTQKMPPQIPGSSKISPSSGSASAGQVGASDANAQAIVDARPVIEIINDSNLLRNHVPLSDKSIRTGLVALKKGMTHVWDRWGVMTPLTILELKNVQVVQVKTPAIDGYTALQIGAMNVSKVKRPNLGHFNKHNVPPKRHMAEFRVTPDALLAPGTLLTAAHFVPGQYVDVTGITKGKGFQGGMKRHGFKGQPASHGASLVHRAMGSAGGGGGMGRVFPGKRMAGHMGVDRRMAKSLLVYRINTKLDLVMVKGSVPGSDNDFVEIRDARYGQDRGVKYDRFSYLPFPTFIPDTKKPLPFELSAPPSPTPPAHNYR